MQKVKMKKMLLVLPILAVPFITMAFWALGGGKGTVKKTEDKGLNLDLPDPKLKEDKNMDKLSFYDQADKDSMKMEEWMRNDPYFKKDTEPQVPNEIEEITSTTASKYNPRLNTSLYDKPANNPEDQIMEKLKLLQDQLNKPVETPVAPVADTDFTPVINAPAEEDPDIRQLNGALDKILDIQHPERVKQRSSKNKEAIYAVRRENVHDTLVTGFYSYSDEKELEDQNAIEAVIANNQSIVNGAVVKFRTCNDIYVKGKLVPVNTVVSGIASLEGERLTVEISSIRCGKDIYGVKLDVYDMDGLPGIYIPGTINRDVAKESLNSSLSLADMTAIDPSLKAQATATGIGALKSLISKKTKLVRVQLKAGYKVLFKNKTQDQ